MRALAFLMPCVLVAAPGPFQEFRTPSGLRVILDERHDLPLMRLELRVAWEEGDAAGRDCGSELMCAVLDRCGAAGFTRMALERTLADRGLRLGLERGRASLAWTMLADSQDQEEAFAFLAHAVFRPTLAEGITALQREPKGAVVPEDAFRSALGFPAEGISACELDLPALLSLHRRLVRPEHAVLVVRGDLNLLQLRQLVLLHLGTWAPAAEPPAPRGKAAPVLEPRQIIPGTIPMAWAGSPAPGGGPERRAAQVLLAILLERMFGEGTVEPFTVEAPRPDGDAGPVLFRTLPGVKDPEALLRTRLGGLAAKGFSAGDLAWAKAQWKAERAVLALHPEEQLSAWACQEQSGDPGAFLEATGLEAVNAALQARLSSESLRWLVKLPSPR
jgi:hypothetical protein